MYEACLDGIMVNDTVQIVFGLVLMWHEFKSKIDQDYKCTPCTTKMCHFIFDYKLDIS